MTHSKKMEIELVKDVSAVKLKNKVEKRINELTASNYDVLYISFSTNFWRVPICYITKRLRN